MSCLPGWSERSQRLMRAFRHYVHRNHEFQPATCDGCMEAACFLTVKGYEGDVEHPLTH